MKVVKAVDKKISAMAMALAFSYALVFDGWSNTSKHIFIRMYIVYLAKKVDADPVLHLLLAFAPLHDKTNFTAEPCQLYQGNTALALLVC